MSNMLLNDIDLRFKVDPAAGQFCLAGADMVTYLGETCDIEVLNFERKVVPGPKGGMPVVDFEIKVNEVRAMFGKSTNWFVRHPYFGLGAFTLILKKWSTRKYTWYEPIPTKIESSSEITPCPDCNGSREYVGLFERKACPTCSH